MISQDEHNRNNTPHTYKNRNPDSQPVFVTFHFCLVTVLRKLFSYQFFRYEEANAITINATTLNIVAVSAIPISSMLKLDEYTKSNSVIILDKNKTVTSAVSAMKENSARCVLVSDTEDRDIIGLVSTTDILYRVISLHKNPDKVKLKDIMSSPIISIPLEMSISDALSVMERHDIRQVVVSSDSNIYGIIDREDIITKMEKAMVQMENAFRRDLSAPLCIMNPLASSYVEEKSSLLVCPHCKLEYSKKDSLATHIKETHAFSGTSP